MAIKTSPYVNGGLGHIVIVKFIIGSILVGFVKFIQN
jgi:hypothetical protein